MENDKARPKKFKCCASLQYEKERLETFIDWPITYISPKELAANGFYYLRTKDHCACVFCTGTVGDWEENDIPMVEHKRHFPYCPFVLGCPVGNITFNESVILDKMPLDGEDLPIPGTDQVDEISLHPETILPHSPPFLPDFSTYESRFNSFEKWPEKISQTPEELSNAGFFYCKISDHVRCYYCGNGLRNWQENDDPWEEHARWYPNCYLVHVIKGREFIEKILSEKPLYLRTAVSTIKITKTSSGNFNPISDDDFEQLMKSDIIKDAIIVKYPLDEIRTVLRRKLEQTGMPFFNVEDCYFAIWRARLQFGNARGREGGGGGGEDVTGIHNKSHCLGNAIIPHLNSLSINNDEEEILPQNRIEYYKEEDRICKICMDKDIEIVFIPCSHSVACGVCTLKLIFCPICRRKIDFTLKPIRS